MIVSVFNSLFGWLPAAGSLPPSAEPQAIDMAANQKALEERISGVGRERVFARARALGWGPYGEVPIFVWWNIVMDIEAEDAAARAAARAMPL